jgi:hypothetical protein
MKRDKSLASLGLIVFGLAALLSSAGAEEAPVAPSAVSQEDLSLQGFALQNPFCREWTDGCSACKRDEKDAPHCSTPGIACQPDSIHCQRETTK